MLSSVWLPGSLNKNQIHGTEGRGIKIGRNLLMIPYQKLLPKIKQTHDDCELQQMSSKICITGDSEDGCEEGVREEVD